MADTKLDQQRRDAEVESHKMEFEVHKTQATLSGGTALAVIAITELMLPQPLEYRWMLFAAMTLVVFSTGYALATMLSLTTVIRETLAPGGGPSEKQENTLTKNRQTSMLSFVLGVGLSAWFLALNLFW